MNDTAQTREFEVGDILSVLTGTLVSRRLIGGVYDLCNHMTGDNLMTHQLPRASDECSPSLKAQFPDLAAIEMPKFNGPDTVFAWLDGIEATHGKTRHVTPLPAADHTVIDPIAELKLMRPDMEVIVIDGGSAS